MPAGLWMQEEWKYCDPFDGLRVIVSGIEPMIKLDKVSKKFGTGVFGLSDITIDVDKGEF